MAKMDPEMKRFLQILPQQEIETSVIEFLYKPVEGSYSVQSRSSSIVTTKFYDFLDELNELIRSENEIMRFRFIYADNSMITLDLLLKQLTLRDTVEFPLKELAAANLIGCRKFIEKVEIVFTEEENGNHCS